MKYVERLILLIFGVAILFVIHQLTAILMASHGWKGLSPSDWAAWVQALGSIGAIIGAYLFGERQARASREVALLTFQIAESRQHKQIIAIADEAWAIARSVLDIFVEGGYLYLVFRLGYNGQSATKIATALEKIELQSIESARVVALVRDLQIAFADMTNNVTRVTGNFAFGENGGIRNDQWCDTGSIRIAARNVARNVSKLHDELKIEAPFSLELLGGSPTDESDVA